MNRRRRRALEFRHWLDPRGRAPVTQQRADSRPSNRKLRARKRYR